ncbi:Synaptotagmin-like protein 4 [Holothuria leucospilota]|uniref:Synaptotagmin-like protein 4 n=1 Tax=Holothuria leucospilota TaxID=206669 RepID=A0A9Q1BGE1_HOLLE|nr:Synaptotagmin-like protein 4 [Holothuria leucospilota]
MANPNLREILICQQSEEEEVLEEKEIKAVEMGVQEAEHVPQDETGEGLEVDEQEPEHVSATGEGNEVDEECDEIATEEDVLKQEEEGCKDFDQEAHVVFQEREEDASKGEADIEKTEEVSVQMEAVKDEVTEDSQQITAHEVMTEQLTEVEDPEDSEMVVINYSEDKGFGINGNNAGGDTAEVVTAEEYTEKKLEPVSPQMNGEHQGTQTEVDVDVHIDVSDNMSHTIQVSRSNTLPADTRNPEGSGRSSATGSFSRRETSGALAKIQKDDFKKASRTSLASLYSNADESYRLPVTGDVNFGTSYNYKTNTFEVKVQSCRDLVPVDSKRNRSNPYVKLYLLPDRSKQSKRKTSVKKSTINPVYSETLRYKIRQSELETRTLCVAVWHYDRFGHNLFLGENLLSLDTIQFDDYSPRWHALSQRQRQSTSALTYTGDVLVAVMYEALSEDEEKDRSSRYHKGRKNKAPGRMIGGTLHVQIKEAKNLVGMKLGGSSSPVCKCYLLPDRTKHGKKKTTVKKNTCNPKWTEILKFENVTRDSLLERCLEVTVWDYDSVGSDSLMGGVRLGLGSGKSYGKAVDWMDSSGKEVTVWREMLKNPNHWVETTMTLRGNVGKTKK